MDIMGLTNGSFVTMVNHSPLLKVQMIYRIPLSYTGINEKYLKDRHVSWNIPKADTIIWVQEFVLHNDFYADVKKD